MKYLKVLCLFTIVATAVMASIGSASAATLTSPAGNVLGPGTTLHAESEGTAVIDGTINISCHLTFHAEISTAGGKHGGTTTTVGGPVKSWNFFNCTNHTVTVTNNGSWEIHSLGNGNGTLTSTGLTFTVLTHSVFLGTRHCFYATNNTHIGTITGTANRPASTTTATLDVDSAPLPQHATDSLCGNDAELTAGLEFKTPDDLYVD